MLQKWYPGHMAKAIKQLQADISRSQIGAIIEVRDSRVPLSCTNWQFENLLLGESAGRGKLTLEFKDPWGKKYGSSVNKPHRVILCNKYDRVGEANAHSKIPEWRYNLTENFSNFTKVPVFFGSKADKDSLNKLMMHLVQNWIELHSSKMARFPNCVYPPLNIAVIGLPNTGKSSIINSLRVIGSGISGKNGAKVAKVGKNPGYTKSISSKIKIIDSETPINLGENDKRHYLEITKMLFSKGIRLQVFVIDSPGILPPHLSTERVIMNLAAVNCIPLDPAVSRGVDPVVVAEFLWNWIKADPDRFQLFASSFDVDYSANLYDVLCNIFDFKGGKSSAEMEAACSKFLRLWRDGLIDCSDKSNFILDDEVFDQESLKKWFLLNYGQLSAKMRKS